MLALIAGQGRLPVLLAQRLLADRVRFQVLELAGFAFENPGRLPVTRFRIEHLGNVIDRLLTDGVAEVCLAGAIRRPVIDPAQVDTATAPMLATIKNAIGSGDDAALRAILSLFTKRGLTIRAAQDIMPDLLPPSDILTRRQPDHGHLADAGVGWGVLHHQGAADRGQACVISGGRVVAQEGDAGTDVMLAGMPELAGGILFKGPKPDQDRRVDLPTIGVQTVAGVARAGLDGIVIGAQGVLVLDLADVVSACDRAGMFLAVLEHP